MTDLDTRYGRRSRRSGIVAVAVTAGVLVVAALVWFVWANPVAVEFSSRDTGYRILSDSEVEVAFEVTAPPGTSVSCALQALSSDFGTVGWRIITLPGDDTRIRTYHESVRTSQPAVTGLVYRCWLT